MPQSRIDDLKAELAKAEAELYNEVSAKFPKWVSVHPTQVREMPDGSVQTNWPDTHKDRDGNVTVLVQDEDEEFQAGAAVVPPSDPKPEAPPSVETANKETLQ